MRLSLKLATFATALLLGGAAISSADAQKATRGTGDAGARKAWLKEHPGATEQKWDALPAEQKQAWKEFARAYRDERKAVKAQVEAGKLDKKTGAKDLKAWRAAHKPKTG